MRTMRRMLWLAGCGWALLWYGETASAQQPVTAPVVAIPQAMPGPIAPAPSAPTTISVPSQAMPAVPAAQAGAVSATSSAASGSACNGGMGTALGAGKAPIQFGRYGRSCANGCGSFAGNCGFIFGSCRSFFDPCGPLPLGCKKCPTLPFGHPYGTGANRCTYDSYLNH